LDTSGEEERAPDPEAYALALRANYLSKDSSTSGRREAVELYRQALDIDANLGVVWSNLATTYINQVIAGEIDWNEGYRNSRDAAIRAISVTPGHPAGYTSLSFIQRYFEGDLPAAISNMELALQKDPHGIDVLAEASVLLMNIGQLDEAVRLQEEIVERSPVDVISVWNLALRYRYADRLEESERMYRRVLELSPEYATINYNLGETLLLMGEFKKAADQFAKEDDEAYRIKGMALTQFSLGRYGEADRSLEQLIEKYGERWPSEVAHVYAWRGEIDPAFDWLDKEYDTYGAGGWGEWQLQRLYDNLRDDPRWNAFLTRTGTSPEQLASLSLRLPGASN
jgi:tetratricopeptide (TPR) repeat protein